MQEYEQPFDFYACKRKGTYSASQLGYNGAKLSGDWTHQSLLGDCVARLRRSD